MSVLLAKPWTDRVDPTGWWMSEKLDGVRAIWNPERQVFLSRNGKEFYAPRWFKGRMPRSFLDGELFAGRGRFNKTVSIVRAHGGDGWDDIKFKVFDFYPVEGGNSLSFEKRQERLRDLALSAHVKIVKQTKCTSLLHMTQFADRVDRLGGEGVMLRMPGSWYEKKRSGTLLKVKKFHDLEAEVVGHVPGKGKHHGRMGALDCVIALDTDVKFQVGTGFTDEERENPPKVGDVITVRYQELTPAGVPRFPVYITARDYE